jgi:hypothetical protein
LRHSALNHRTTVIVLLLPAMATLDPVLAAEAPVRLG